MSVEPKTRKVKVKQHHNSSMSMKAAETIAEAAMVGKDLESTSLQAGYEASQTTFRHIREVRVPADFPTTREAIDADIVTFLEIAVWKASRRLADTGMDEMDLRNLPVAMGISTEKLQLMRGSPTSYSVQAHLSVSQNELLSRLRAAKPSGQVPITDVVRTLSAEKTDVIENGGGGGQGDRCQAEGGTDT